MSVNGTTRAQRLGWQLYRCGCIQQLRGFRPALRCPQHGAPCCGWFPHHPRRA